MYKYLILIIVIVSSGIAQDVLMPPKLINKDTCNIIENEMDEFNYGWNWGKPGEELDEALNINSYHHIPLLINKFRFSNAPFPAKYHFTSSSAPILILNRIFHLQKIIKFLEDDANIHLLIRKYIIKLK